jgi:hypothetical protein
MRKVAIIYSQMFSKTAVKMITLFRIGQSLYHSFFSFAKFNN